MDQETVQEIMQRTPTSDLRGPIAAIIVVSAAAIVFLSWLLYIHPPAPEFAARFNFLRPLEAVLNGLSAIALVMGFYFIRHKQIARHRASMTTAFIFSSLFLISYIANHALHGDVLYPGHGTIRTVYLAILSTHILLSIVVLPLVLITFFFSLSGRFPQHKRIARYTFPVWLYVSITGVVVYAMLAGAH